MSTSPTDDLERQLGAAGDRDDARQMTAYMKGRFEFFGVKTPQRRTLSKNIERASKSLTIGDLIGLVDDLRSRRHRELHYVASDVLRANRTRLPASMIGDVERWIVRDPWWDTVDAIASPTVGEMVLRHPELLAVMDDWIEAGRDTQAGDGEMWLARAAIIHHLRFGDSTDTNRLFGYCLRRADDSDFFIRKAIGWALRQYARTDPEAVRTFVDQHRDELSPLSVREATKHLWLVGSAPLSSGRRVRCGTRRWSSPSLRGARSAVPSRVRSSRS